MPTPKKLANKHRIIMYVDQLAKFKISLYMKSNNIPSYSEFLRLATFFLINNGHKSTKTLDIWQTKKVVTKVSILDDPKHKVKLEVMNELKQLFATGTNLLKKIE